MPSKTRPTGLSPALLMKPGIALFGMILALFAPVRNANANAAADLGWDLSYQSVIRKHALNPQEFLYLWVNSFPSRPIQQRMQEYQGDPILGSVLVEQPDGHAGAPMATWIIQTAKGGLICTIHERYPNRPCEPLNPDKIGAFIGEVLQFKPLPPRPRVKPVIDKDADGKPIFYSYTGLLSVYRQGEVKQRPIALLETDDFTPPAGTPPDPDARRLSHAMARMLLTDETLKQREAGLTHAERQRQLRFAVGQGDIDTASRLLDQGMTGEKSSNINDASSLLAIAANQGQTRMVDFLLSRGHQIDAGEGMALKAAVSAGDKAMIEHLLGKGAMINPPNDSPHPSERLRNSPLGVAVQKGDLGMVQWLVGKGANVNIDQDRPAIVEAAMRHDLSMLDYLLEQGALPDSMEGNGGNSALMTLMEYSSRWGRRHQDPAQQQAPQRWDEQAMVLARHLVAAGSDVNLTNRICYTAYVIAGHRHNAGMQKLLLELGADPKAHEKCEAARGLGK